VEEDSATALETSANPTPVGSAVTLTASVASTTSATAPNEGTVDFAGPGGLLCDDVAVDAGVAICSVTFASPGALALTAEYSGATGLAGSTGTLTQAVEEVRVVDPPVDPPAAGPGPDELFGSGADDALRGLGGDDELRGRGGDDDLKGGDGDDSLFGGDGDDVLDGGAGRDRLSGGTGNDRLIGGPGVDVLDCGPGADTAVAGRRDRVRGNCEVVS
jgi:hypothetical protein